MQVLQAACLSLEDGCGLDQRPYAEFATWVAAQQKDEVPLFYNVASIWAGWIQANSDDFMAIAELGRVKALMQGRGAGRRLCERQRIYTWVYLRPWCCRVWVADQNSRHT